MLKRFSQISSLDVTTCGGKGASLGEMTQAGFPVPNGFVLTTQAFGVSPHKRDDVVLHAFDQLNCKFVGVRSSGTKEDGSEDSFAGQFDTYLFVSKEKLIEQILECHASVKSDRILAYCKSKGINPDDIKVAVVVQKMVNAESAGVCFTANPITGNREEIMIEAGYGLGEAVVSGMITPDNYIVSAPGGEAGGVKGKDTGTSPTPSRSLYGTGSSEGGLHKTISIQTKKIVLDTEKGGTREEVIEPTVAGVQKLSDKHILQLADYAVEIEKHYGKPMDIERAVEDGELFILQARPITTLGEGENTHWEVHIGDKTYTPYFWENAEMHFKYNGYVFFSSIFMKCFSFPFSKYTAPATYINYYGDKGVCEDFVRNTLLEKGNNGINNLLDHQQEYADILTATNRDIEDCTKECEEYLKNGSDDFEKIWPNIKTNFSRGWLFFHFSYALEVWLEQLKKTDEHLYISLTEHIIAPKKSFLDEAIDNLKKLIREHPDNFDTVYEKFMEQYGWFQNSYLGINTDITKERLKNYIGKEEEATTNRNVTPKLVDEKYHLLVEMASKTINFQDNKKKLMLVSVVIMENWLRKISKKIHIPYQHLLWLSVDEILSYDITSQHELDKLAEKAKKYAEQGERYGIMTEIGYEDISKEFWDKVVALNTVKNHSTTIKGSVGNKGKLTGKVRIVLSTKDFPAFQEGEILVTSMTRPEYLPLMKKASAFITDEGGITCHAAIVARELNKPCIIGTKIATQVLKNGDLVEVDANEGVVRIVEQ